MTSPITIELSGDEFKEFRRSVEHEGGAMVPCAFEPELYQPVPVTLEVEGVDELTITGQVVHWNTELGEMALTFDEDAKAEIARAARRLMHKSGDGAVDDEPVWVKYQGLSKAEKLKWARHGNVAERRAVLKDRDVSLHMQVLNNPGLTPKEIAGLIRAGGVSPGFVRKVCERSEFMANPQVVAALVKNPLTPTDIAVKLVERIPVQLARQIAKSRNYRPAIVAAAKKRVTR